MFKAQSTNFAITIEMYDAEKSLIMIFDPKGIPKRIYDGIVIMDFFNILKNLPDFEAQLDWINSEILQNLIHYNFPSDDQKIEWVNLLISTIKKAIS